MTIRVVSPILESVLPAAIRPEPSLHPVNEQDWPFIYELFKSTRAWEMSLVDWSDEQKETFLQQQFHAQKVQYIGNYPMGEHNIVLLDGRPIGRIYTAELKNEVVLLDVILAPEARNQGVGSFLMEQLKEQARRVNKPLRFYVWQLNHAAQRFYQRHDCYFIDELGAYLHMEWKPE